MMKLLYHIIYQYSSAPWDNGPRSDLVDLVESGRLQPGKAIDLGCGTGSNCIYLAQQGFQVTGVDYTPAAIEIAQDRAQNAGVKVDFLFDDLTNLKHVSGTYDLLVDYGTLDDLRPKGRDLYMQNVLPLASPGSKFLLYAHEWKPTWWEGFFYSGMALDLGEATTRFSSQFQIEEITRIKNRPSIPRGYAVYLMTKI
jgi:cyclopropane fatty-acyl-phospholipid synthase-like methyltransferase